MPMIQCQMLMFHQNLERGMEGVTFDFTIVTFLCTNIIAFVQTHTHLSEIENVTFLLWQSDI